MQTSNRWLPYRFAATGVGVKRGGSDEIAAVRHPD
jgi:hypothetical protein